jgi:predicted GNAT family acetyltransferase
MLDLLLKYISEMDPTLEHYGVKGMHWGVRKADDSSGSKPVLKAKTEDIAVKLKNGDTLTLGGNRTGLLTKFMARVNPKKIDEYNKDQSFKITDKNGKNVGEMYLTPDSHSSDKLNVVWVGIKNSARGNGYASAAIRAAIDHAKAKNYKAVTLEVPGNAPDARHIYEKLGFKEVYTPPELKADDPVWGGLTNMELSLSDGDVKHYGVKGMHWGVRRNGPSGVSSKTNREARSDAKEFARAKMFYGEGAGTRRKLIKAAVEGKSKKDPAYQRAFDHHLSRQDMSKHAEKARGERKRKNVKKSAGRGIRGTRHILNGNSQYASAATAIAVGGALYAHKAGIDKIVLDKGKQAFNKIRDPEGLKRAQNLLRDMGIG